MTLEELFKLHTLLCRYQKEHDSISVQTVRALVYAKIMRLTADSGSM
jgi:hypothetical protein